MLKALAKSPSPALWGPPPTFFGYELVNTQGPGTPSSEMEATAYDGPTPTPGAPTNLAATPGDLQVTLSWDAPSAGASVITHYEYQYSTTSGTFGGTWANTSGTGTTVTVSGLMGTTAYFFRVRAVNTQGPGTPSSEMEATAYDGTTPTPGAPTNLAATPGDLQVTLSWDAPSAGASVITRYEYQYSMTSGTFGGTWATVTGTGTTVTVSGLTGATTYFFRVRAVNGQGPGTPSSEMEATAYDGTTPTPGAPPTLTVTPGNRQVTLSWEAPRAGASPITRYEYQYKTASGTFGDTWTPVTGTETTVSSLTGATTYFFRVRAVNAQGAGTPSSEIEATAYDGSTAEPGAPTNLEATPGDGQVTLSWEAPSHIGDSEITGYEYQYKPASGTFGDTWTPVTGTETTVSGLTGATTYFFRVRAVNGEGSGHPTQVSVTPYDGSTAEPGAPTNLAAISGDRQVTLNWEAPSAGASVITRYEYQYSTTSGTFDENIWTRVSGAGTTVTVSGLTGATTYFFRVRAVNTQGPGAPSSEMEATAYDGPTPEPGQPTNLAVTSGDRQVTLSWEAPSAVGASVITRYEYQYSTTSETFGDTWTPVTDTGTTVTVSNLTGATTYFFRVRAVNTQGGGTPSSEIEATAYDGPTPTPGTPTNLAVTPGDRQVTLSWEAPSAGASPITHYEYQYSTTSGIFDDIWTIAPSAGTTITVSSLIGTTTYTFRVRAVNTQGDGTPSSEIEATAYDGPTPEPGQPTNLAVTSGDRQVTLSWEAPSAVGASAITHYEYQYSTTSETFGDTWTPVTGTETTVSSLTGATTYTFRVRAVNTQGDGTPSSEIEATAYDGLTPEPGQPTNLAATPGDRQVTLSWEAPSTVGASAITHYEYQYSTTSGTFDESTWTLAPGTGTTITVSGLTGATTYTFRVRAVNTQGAGTQGAGTPSSEMSATPYDGPTNPEAVCNDPETTDSALPGLGTAEEPFVLCSPAHLNFIGGIGTNAAYTLSASYVMGQDIDLNNASFTPLTGAFTGTLDGNGKRIMHLTISTNNNAAFFLELGSGGNIKNLGIEEFDVRGSGRVGTLVATSFGTITNCYAVDVGAFTDLFGGSSSDSIGGLVGYQGGGLITSSYATGHLHGGESGDSVGGLVGWQNGGRITSSYATGHADGGDGDSDSVGGLVGYQKDSSIISSYAIGRVDGGDGDSDSVGGLVGHQEDGSIISSYATGDPDGEGGNDRVGGLVGHQEDSSILSSYAIGRVDGGDGDSDSVGGLVGYQLGGSVTSSYGFGAMANGETSNTHGAPPDGVTLASDLTQVNSGDSETNRWSTDAWDFSISSQAPALKYVDSYGDHDSDANTPDTYTCAPKTAFLPSIEIICGTTLLPRQPSRICSDLETTDSDLPGSGTIDDPFVLCSPTHLSLIGTDATYTLSAHYMVGQDIDLNNVSFTPIAGSFTGTLDGRDKKIMNLTINVSGHAALFLKLGSGGNIKNLGIENFDVTGSERVGSLVATSFGTITHCYAVDSDDDTDLSGGDSSQDSVGGLVGYQEDSSITSSYATGNPDGGGGNDRVGGLVGYQKDSSIISSYASGDPNGGEGTDVMGGLVGYHYNSSITSSYAIGRVDGGGGSDHVGGLVGAAVSSSITSSYATGDVGGGGRVDHVGGLVGYDYSGSITSSYATGDPDGGEGADRVGGLVGFQSTGDSITSSYATGNPNGGVGVDYVGGLVGYQDDSSITSSYATGNPDGGEGADHVGGLVGFQDDSSIISSYATGDPNGGGNGDSVGGLVGYQDDSSTISSYAIGNPSGEGGTDRVGGLVGRLNGHSVVTSSYATGDPDGGEDGDSVGGLVGEHSIASRITSSYATGDPNGEGGADRVGGLVGRLNGNSVITSSYATGDPDGGEGVDSVGSLVGIQGNGSPTLTSSYGFGTGVNGETPNTLGAPPSDVTSASGLTQTNSGDSDTNRWSAEAWDFGTDSQIPALKYVDDYILGDHDSDDTTADTYAYTCTPKTVFLPPLDITCGTTLLPDQGR